MNDVEKARAIMRVWKNASIDIDAVDYEVGHAYRTMWPCRYNRCDKATPDDQPGSECPDPCYTLEDYKSEMDAIINDAEKRKEELLLGALRKTREVLKEENP